MPAKVDPNAFELLGKMIQPPPVVKPKGRKKAFMPSLTATQEKLFFDEDSRFVLAWGEKGSGKSIGCLHKLVKHCYDNRNALGLILVRVKSMANKGGAWDKLQSFVLPEWVEGLGLNCSEVKMDSQHNEFIWIQNQFGEWSMIVLISAPHANQLKDRIRGFEPSMVFVDELTSCDSEIYFSSVAAQLGRRPYVAGAQQYLGACNPDGPGHWVHIKWFVEAFNEETGVWDTKFRELYFPVSENRSNLTDGYIEHLETIFKDNPTEYARMVSGEWVDKPSGEGIFRELYNPAIHMRPLDEDGKPMKNECILPAVKMPIIIGLDPGSVHNAWIFMQYMLVEKQMCWVIFDEIVTIRRRISYPDFVPMVMRRVKYWRERMEAKEGDLPQVWISDNSAFNQYRAASGSFDVLEIEKIYETSRKKYSLEPLKVKQCPKFNGSIPARVGIAQRLLNQDDIIVSTRCQKVNKMFLQLDCKGQKQGEPFDPAAATTPKRSDHLHVFDAMTYPMLMASITPTALVPPRKSTQTLYGGDSAAA